LDEVFVQFCDFSFLLADEVLQFFDPVHGFFPAVIVYFGFSFCSRSRKISSAMAS